MKKKGEYIEFLLAAVKYVFGILSCSIGLFSEAMFNISIILKSISVTYNKDNKNTKWSNVYNIVVGALIVIVGCSIILNIFTSDIEKVKWYMVIVSILSILIFNIKNSIIYTLNYEKKDKEIVSTYRNYMSSMIISYVVLVGYLLTLLSKFAGIFKYSDALVGGLISVYIIFTGFRYIVVNFNGIKDDSISEEHIKSLINRYSVVKTINSFELLKYGSSYKLVVNLSLDKDANRVDVYPALLDMCNLIFKSNKFIEFISISKSPLIEKKRVVRSARNSGSRNSKKNSTKKNTKKKNKKG